MILEMRDMMEMMDNLYAQSDCDNHSQYAQAIGVGRAAVSKYFSGDAVPSDKTIIRMAAVSNRNALELILQFNMYRSEGEVKASYQTILRKISATVLIAFTFGMSHNALYNGTLDTSPVSEDTSTVYYE